MRRLLFAALLIGGAAVLLTAAPAVSAGSKPARPEGRCKVVVKKVHGHRKRVRVCKKKPKPKPKPKPAPKPKADLALSVTPSLKRITAGNQLVYEVRLANLGPETADGVELSITFPAGAEAVPSFSGVISSEELSDVDCEGNSEQEGGSFTWRCSLDELPPKDTSGDQETPELLMRFIVEPEEAGPFTVGAKANADTQDPNPANSDVQSTIDVLEGPASADLSVSVEAAPDPAAFPGELVETIKVTNHGPSEATFIRIPILLPLGVVVADFPLPVGDCPYYASGPETPTLCFDVVQPGETVEAKIALAPLGAAPPTLETNLLVAAYTPDPNLANNRASASVAVTPFTPVPGVDLVASLHRPQLYEGRYFVVPFGLANRGSSEASGAHVVIVASGPVGEIGAAVNGPTGDVATIGPCDRTQSGTLDCAVSAVASGDRVSGFFYGELTGTGELKVTLAAIAAGDANPADNTASISSPVGPSPARR